ncbi:hypothetical protein BD414DRAFT_422704, partial [Trametes punicea]
LRADIPIIEDEFGWIYYSKLPIARIIGIACTASSMHYFNRPDEGRYQWMKKLLGEPTWFRYPLSERVFWGISTY